MVAGDGREPGLQICSRAPAVDRATHQRLGVLQLLGFDCAAECPERVGRQSGGIRQRVDRSIAFGLGDAGDRLHDRQRPLVALVEVDHGQAIGGRGDRVAPAEVGPRGAVVHRLPDQFAGVGVGLQQPDHVAADLTDVVALDSAAQAGQQSWPHRFDVGLGAA